MSVTAQVPNTITCSYLCIGYDSAAVEVHKSMPRVEPVNEHSSCRHCCEGRCTYRCKLELEHLCILAGGGRARVMCGGCYKTWLSPSTAAHGQLKMSPRYVCAVPCCACYALVCCALLCCVALQTMSLYPNVTSSESTPVTALIIMHTSHGLIIGARVAGQ